MKQILFILPILFLTVYTNAQDSTKTTKHFIGLHAGTTTGIGFSYRFWPKKIGIQITTIPTFSPNKNIYFSSGISALLTLKQTKHIDIFSYLGNHLLYEQDRVTQYNDFGELVTFTKKEYTYNIGIGFGLKVNFLKNLDLSLQAGYGLYDLNKTINTKLAGEIGLYYHL